MEHPFLIYDASAGSGKTYTLVKEYLKIVFGSKSPDAYKNILAITFTNKAVHEMKSRIVNSLSAFAKDPDATDQKQRPSAKDLDFMEAIGREIGLNQTQMRHKAREILRHLIHNYAAFDISTIDKFTHKVIRAFARDLNLPLTFEVSVEDDALLREAVDALVAKAGEDPELTKLLLQYAMEKADDDKSWEIAREIYETGRLSRNETDRAELSAFDEFSISDFENVRANLKEAIEQIGEEMAAAGHEIQRIIQSSGIDEASFGRSSFPNFYKSAIAGTYKTAPRVFDSYEKLAVKKNAPDAALIESVSDQLLELSGRIYKLYARRCLYQDVLKTIVPLSLLNTLSGALNELQREKNILPISDFNALIHKELQEQPAPFVYERLGERYRHFFIDEFQDTSQMQWENLIPLIHDSLSGSDAAGRAGSLLLVGDPKQSIYRWRGGKAEQFIALAANHNPFANIAKKTERLAVNYRSYDTVIEFNNRFFKFAATRFENPEYRRLYEELSHQECNDKKGGFVQINFVEKTRGYDPEDPDEEEADNPANLQRMLEIVADLHHRGFAYSEMAILVRKVAQGTAAAKCLSEHGIPLLSSEILMLANAEEVKFMLSVLRYLHNEEDVVSKARALQFIGAHLQEQLPVADFIAQGMAVTNDEMFADWLLSQGVGLNFQMLRLRGLFEVVEHISQQLPQRQSAYVQYFLDIALEREQRYQSGLGDFLDYWNVSGEKLSIPLPESEDAVRIMTIHKSKGLEFPVVIMPFADDDFGRVMRGTKIWIDNPGDETLALPKMLLNQSAQIKTYGDRASEIYSQKEQERLLDNINILYVALTRAGEQLHMISTLKRKKDGTPMGNTTASLLVDFLSNNGEYAYSKSVYTFGDPRKVSAPVSAAAFVETIRGVDFPMPFSRIKIAKREALMWGTTQSEAIGMGNLLHEILSAVTNVSNIDEALDSALDSGIISASQRQIFYDLITEIATHPGIAHCFDDSMRVLNEQIIIRPDAPVLKPDRISIDPQGNIHLIDYKTGAPTQAHRQQIESYAQALSQMGYGAVKKSLVYTRPQLNVVHL